MKQRTAKPIRKVATGGLTALVSSALIYAFLRSWHISLSVADATFFATLIVGGLSFAASWLVPAHPDDDPIVSPRQRPAKRRARPGSDPLDH
jgi:hypothetical protein